MLKLVLYLHFDISHMKGSDIAQSLSFNAKLVTEYTAQCSTPPALLGCNDCQFLKEYKHNKQMTTVLLAKSDSEVMFVYKVIRDLQSIDHLCINPIRAG